MTTPGRYLHLPPADTVPCDVCGDPGRPVVEDGYTSTDATDEMDAQGAAMTAQGPYDTREQALAGITPATGRPDQARRYDMLKRAAAAAGAELGEFDRLVLGWLAGWEPDTVQVIVALIGRAHAAGRNQLAEEIAALHAQVDALETAARHGAPVEIDFRRIRHGANGGPR